MSLVILTVPVHVSRRNIHAQSFNKAKDMTRCLKLPFGLLIVQLIDQKEALDIRKYVKENRALLGFNNSNSEGYVGTARARVCVCIRV